MVGHVRTKAIIDTGAQGTVGNLKLRDALMRRIPTEHVRSRRLSASTLDVQSGD